MVKRPPQPLGSAPSSVRQPCQIQTYRFTEELKNAASVDAYSFLGTFMESIMNLYCTKICKKTRSTFHYLIEYSVNDNRDLSIPASELL